MGPGPSKPVVPVLHPQSLPNRNVRHLWNDRIYRTDPANRYDRNRTKGKTGETGTFVNRFPPIGSILRKEPSARLCAWVSVQNLTLRDQMKTNQNKSIGKPLTGGLFVLGLAVALPLFGGDGAPPKAGAVPNAHYEMVPHVVLPESIQYTPGAREMNHLASRSWNSSPGGVTSPFVASYTAYPSYQLPYGTPMKTVGQSVYPVSPKPLPLPEPKTGDDDSVSDELTLTEPQTLKTVGETSPILLAANTEEIVPAMPIADLSTEITQTGIFCAQQPKTPTAWSFTSPLFKAASVPMGNGGFINQMGLYGSAAQVGFSPVGGYGMPGMMGNPMMTPQQGGPQCFTLPNGFAVMSLPPSHANCGPIRCRQTGPQWMLLPPGPMGAPMNAPAPQMAPPLPGDPAAFMMMPTMQSMQTVQPQPITAMTPYGMIVVGYRPAPMPVPYGMNPMMGAGMNPTTNPYQAAYVMQIQQLQQQVQLLQQQNAQLMSKKDGEGENKDAQASGEPPVPLPINPQAAMQQQLLQQLQMFGYAPYGQLYAADANASANPLNTGTENPMMANPAMMGMNPCPPMMSPPMMYPPMMYPPMMGQNSMMYGGNPYMMCGMNGGGFNQGGMSTSDMLMLMMLMKDNQPRRQGIFARLAARRAERQNAGQNDMFQQMMQAWCTPYMPMDAAMRMPARNAYPYGYFGAQVGPQETANYGGCYNLYMGNTTYPGLY